MDRAYQQMFDKVEEIKKELEKVDAMTAELVDVRKAAREYFANVVKRYEDQESVITDQMKLAEEENEQNKQKIVCLTGKQIQVKTSGGTFTETEYLDRLKTEVATYPLKREALEKVLEGIKVSAEDYDRLRAYQAEAGNITRQKHAAQSRIADLISDIRGDCAMNCLATMENIPGRNEFMTEEFKRLSKMRLEENE